MKEIIKSEGATYYKIIVDGVVLSKKVGNYKRDLIFDDLEIVEAIAEEKINKGHDRIRVEKIANIIYLNK